MGRPLATFELRVAALHMQCKCSLRELQGVLPMAAENRMAGDAKAVRSTDTYKIRGERIANRILTAEEDEKHLIWILPLFLGF
jgi:hypothetical protein